MRIQGRRRPGNDNWDEDAGTAPDAGLADAPTLPPSAKRARSEAPVEVDDADGGDGADDRAQYDAGDTIRDEYPGHYIERLLAHQVATAVQGAWTAMPLAIAQLVAAYAPMCAPGGLIFTNHNSGLLERQTPTLLTLLGEQLRCAHVPRLIDTFPNPEAPRRPHKVPDAEIQARVRQLRILAPRGAARPNLLKRLHMYADHQPPPQHACGELTLVYDSVRDGPSVGQWRAQCARHPNTLTIMYTREWVQETLPPHYVRTSRHLDTIGPAVCKAALDRALDAAHGERPRPYRVDVALYRARRWEQEGPVSAASRAREPKMPKVESLVHAMDERDRDMSFLLPLWHGAHAGTQAHHHGHRDWSSVFPVPRAEGGPRLDGILATVAEQPGDPASRLRYVVVDAREGEFIGVDCARRASPSLFIAEIVRLQTFVFYDHYAQRGNAAGHKAVHRFSRPQPPLPAFLRAQMRPGAWVGVPAEVARCIVDRMRRMLRDVPYAGTTMSLVTAALGDMTGIADLE